MASFRVNLRIATLRQLIDEKSENLVKEKSFCNYCLRMTEDEEDISRKTVWIGMAETQLEAIQYLETDKKELVSQICSYRNKLNDIRKKEALEVQERVDAKALTESNVRFLAEKYQLTFNSVLKVVQQRGFSKCEPYLEILSMSQRTKALSN